MSGSAEPIAQLCGAVFRYGRITALHGVDLALHAGRITVLLGPNGAGKTTAIRLLLGALAPTAGTAMLFGLDPRARGARARVGAMLQVAKVPELLTVREHIDTFRSYYREPQPAAELLRLAGIERLAERRFGTLSGGERQRVLFALALAGDPQLLFLDEPTVGMDVDTRRAFWESVRALRADGRAVLLTTHQLEEADAVADRVVVLNGGRIIADGAPADIKRTVARQRIRCTSTLPLERIHALDGVDAAARENGHLTITTARAAHVLRTLLALDPALEELEVHGAGLEEAFLHLTRTGRGEA